MCNQLTIIVLLFKTILCENVYWNGHTFILDMLYFTLFEICKYTESFPQWYIVIFVKTEDERLCQDKFSPQETDLLVKQVVRQWQQKGPHGLMM